MNRVRVIVFLGLAMVLSGCSLVERFADSSGEEMEYQVPSQLPGTDQPGEVEQKQLEAEQRVDPKDTDLKSIEADINSTVILGEDFSDL